MSRIRIGTSGWVYSDWKPIFYPADVLQRAWLPFYASVFPTVEINATFYRLAKRETVERWATSVPAGFRFAVKGSRFITHMKKLKDPVQGLERFYAPLEPLFRARKMGPVLWQLPPGWKPDVGRLKAFVEALPAGEHAVEFREPLWVCDEVLTLLDDAGLALVVHDYLDVRWPAELPGRFAYRRFHGPTRFGRRRLRRAAEETARLGKPAWVYFNNDRGGAAIRDALDFSDLLGLSAPRPPREGPRPSPG